MATVNFTKLEGLGNDFIIIEDLAEKIKPDALLVQKLCDRHFGIGADGLIFVRASREGDFFMDFYNADGSQAEMCGNGIRCFAKYIYEQGLKSSSELVINTRAGLKLVELMVVGQKVKSCRVNMGAPILDSEQIPLNCSVSKFINKQINLGKRYIRATCLSMGNPHCVIFMPTDVRVNDFPVTSLGPRIETLPLFPQKTNVEFVEVISPNKLMVRVWERGVGETLACGTGACASLVAAYLNGLTGRQAEVRLPGGSLNITWLEKDNNVYLEGPANQVFSGSFNLATIIGKEQQLERGIPH